MGGLGLLAGRAGREGLSRLETVLVGVGLSRADAAGQSILSALSTMDLCDDVVLAGVVARLREHPVLARTRQMALSWAREAVAALEGLEESALVGIRERLVVNGLCGQVVHRLVRGRTGSQRPPRAGLSTVP